jgi:glutathione S-transferase
MTIELYVFPRSPRSFKVMALANHLDLGHVLRPLNAAQGEHKASSYSAMNPNMRAPTLKDGSFVLWESNAILQYLAAQKPESGLLPRDERARLDVTRWQFWDLAHWDPACATFAFEYVAKRALGMGEPDTAAVAKATPAFESAARVLDAQLKSRTYVTGDALTIADFSLGAWMTLAEMAHLPVAPFGEIKRWYAGLAALPSWQKTLAQAAAPTATAVA